MLNLWITLLALRPQLLADHASNWAGLLAAESAAAWSQGLRRLGLMLVALLAAAMAVLLAGVALMLWALADPAALQQPWAAPALLGLPLALLVLAAVCAWRAQQCSTEGAPERLARLAQQWRADMALLQPPLP